MCRPLFGIMVSIKSMEGSEIFLEARVKHKLPGNGLKLKINRMEVLHYLGGAS